jgi:DNA-binding response OmpR family regulator
MIVHLSLESIIISWTIAEIRSASMKTVLIVDDEPDVKLALKIALEENGFKVDAFDDPIIALDNFRKGVYDLLILDIKMPKMHGFELYREIRKIDNTVKICFLTAGEMYYGAYADIFNENQFIRKPIENKELISRVNEIMDL